MPSVVPNAPAGNESSAGTTKRPSGLQFPASIIATIAPERYLLSHLEPSPSIRPSGRTPSTFRPVAITTSSLTNCLGSAVVRIGNTAVVCGITPEILYTNEIADPPPSRKRRAQDEDAASARKRRKQDSSDIASLHLLVPNIDLNTGSSTSNQAGQPPSSFTQTLSQRIYRLLLSTQLVDLEDLRITRPKRPSTPSAETPNPIAAGVAVDAEGVGDDTTNDDEEDEETIAYYTLHMNLTVLSLDGHVALIDAAWAATLAALRDLRLPEASWDDEREMVVCSDIAADARRLKLIGAPVICTWSVFTSEANTVEGQEVKSWILADPDGFEESLCRETVSTVIDAADGVPTVLRIEQNGGGIVGNDEMKGLIDAAQGRWEEVMGAMPRPQVDIG